MFWAVIIAIMYARPVWWLELGTWGQKLFIAFIWSQHVFYIYQESFFFFFTVICTLGVLSLLRHHHSPSIYHLLVKLILKLKNKKESLSWISSTLSFLLHVLLQFKWITQFSFIMNWCRSDFDTRKVKSKL